MKKTFRVLGSFPLGFISEGGHGEQWDAFIPPGAFLECDGNTVWAVIEGKRYESTTAPAVIDACLKEKLIEEVGP